MPHESDADLLVLHGVRLKGMAEAPVVAELAGLDGDEVRKRLEVFEADGWARHREGRVSGWVLTALGRAEGERMLAEELERSGALRVVTGAYEVFLTHNQELLDVCTRWQMVERDGEQHVNDHHDPAYDAAVIAQLEAIDRAIQPVTVRLAHALERCASYGPRFAESLRRVQAGEIDWFTKPTIDSYHTVWFELHENFLATLGLERGAEGWS